MQEFEEKFVIDYFHYFCYIIKSSGVNIMLPVVNPEVGFSIAHNIADNTDPEYVKREIRVLERENPAVADFIKRWTSQAANKKSKLHCAFCGILVYKLLASQAQADEMINSINLS